MNLRPHALHSDIGSSNNSDKMNESGTFLTKRIGDMLECNAVNASNQLK